MKNFEINPVTGLGMVCVFIVLGMSVCNYHR